MLNLIIDIGNTRSKLAIFNQNELMINLAVDEISPANIKMLKREYHALNAAILSTTKEFPGELVAALEEELEMVLVLDYKTPLPIENHYLTSESLGCDRLAAAVGANSIFPNHNVLTIDAGTAITYDFVNNKNQYKGGYISPGLNMRFKALNEFTSKLPLIEPGMPENLIGDSTYSSIKGGVQFGIEGELKQMITFFKGDLDELKIILTGGDKNFFECLLKNYNFVTLEITLYGLNTILEFNQSILNKNYTK